MLNHGSVLQEWPSAVLSEYDSQPISESGAGTAAGWQDEVNEKVFHARLGGKVVRIGATTNDLPDWLVGVITELNEIAEYPENWDSYGSAPIPQRTLEHAFQVITKLMDIDTPPPQVGATVEGGVEFEWHRNGKDLEVQVVAPFQVSVYFFDEESGDELDENIGIDMDRIRPYLRRLSG